MSDSNRIDRDHIETEEEFKEWVHARLDGLEEKIDDADVLTEDEFDAKIEERKQELADKAAKARTRQYLAGINPIQSNGGLR